MKEFHHILDKNEEIMWESKPKFWPFFLNSLLPFIFSAGFAVVVYIGFTSFIHNFAAEAPNIAYYPIFGFTAFVCMIGVIPFILRMLGFKHYHYAVTNKRVILQEGVVGRDFDIVDFDQITNIQVNVGLIDKITGGNTGTIFISSASGKTYMRKGQVIQKPFTLLHVQDPYNVFKQLKQISYDIKTDIQYPNQLRPDENPGYNTKYRRK